MFKFPNQLPALQDGSDEWHKRRAQGIGGSDAGTIIGVNDYQDRHELWRIKTGRQIPFGGNSYTQYGTLLEPHIREALRSGGHLDDVGLSATYLHGDSTGYQHPDHEWMLANVDGRIDCRDGEQVGVEIKTASKYRGIPDTHFAQMQHYMAVTGADRWLYVAHVRPMDPELALTTYHDWIDQERRDEWLAVLVESSDLHVELVEHDDAYIARLIERERQFWQCVDNDTEPGEVVPEGEMRADDDARLARLLDQYGRAKATIDQIDKAGTVGGRPIHEVKAEAEQLKKDAKAAAKKYLATIADDDGETPKKVHVGDDYAVWNARGYWQLKPAERTVELDDGEEPAPF